MATVTITDVVTKTLTASGTPSSTLRAPNQGGILEVGFLSQSGLVRGDINPSFTGGKPVGL